MALRKKGSKLKFNNRLMEFLFNPQALPFTLTFTTLAVLFVAFRMKGIEQAYLLNNINNGFPVECRHIRQRKYKGE